jgi:hypothetical protein
MDSDDGTGIKKSLSILLCHKFLYWKIYSLVLLALHATAINPDPETLPFHSSEK